MRHFKGSLLMLFFTLLWMGGNSQSYSFAHYQAEDGLSNNNVVAIFQDSRGMMWLGTKGGLNSFDGYSFKSYKFRNNGSDDIGNNVVISIAEDRTGKLWLGTRRGFFIYDPVKDTFVELAAFSKNAISNIMTDKRDNIWFLADRNLHRYNLVSDTDEKMGVTSVCAAFDENMNIWLGRANGMIVKYEPATKKSTSIRINDEHSGVTRRNITKVLPTSSGIILVGTSEEGLTSYNPKTGLQKPLLARNSDNTEIFVRDIAAAGNDNYWIASESGIYIYNLKNNTSQHLEKRSGDSYSLTDNAVYSLFRDKQGDMWAGTFFGGLNYFSRKNNRFRKFYPIQGTNSISGSAVREICDDKYGNIWIGTEDAGVSRFNPETGMFTSYVPKQGGAGISYPNIHGMLAVDDKLYIGPFFRGLEIMDINTGIVTDRYKLIGEPTGRTRNFVMCLYRTSDSTVLIGTTGSPAGLYIYNTRTKQFRRSEGIPGNSNVLSIMQDHQGTVWTGSLIKGAFYYNTRLSIKGNINFSTAINGKPTDDFQVHGIFEDSNHYIWFTTEGGGLVKLAPDRRSFRKITMKQGLPTNNFFRMLEDDNKNLWISSLKGLVCLNMKTEKFKVYTQSNGLLTDQFNYNSAYKDKNGIMYFGSVKGMIAFNPKQFTDTTAVPPIYFTGFQINNKEISPYADDSPLKKSIIYTDSISLDYDQSNFSVEFAALNYSSPKVTRYRYLMRGLDKEWTYLSSNRRAYFTDLSPGEYTFVVKAESNDGSWTANEKKLFIKIYPPFWKSDVAYALYVVLAGLILWFGFKYYHNYIEKRNLTRLLIFEHEKDKEIYQAKIEFFTNIAHEIQTPLTLITGPLELILKKIDELPSIRRSLTMMEKNSKRLLELTNQLLDFRKTEADQFGLNFVNADIVALLNEQVATFRDEADKKGITITVDMPEKSQVTFIDIEAFKKISSNLLSNAVKYGSTKVGLSLENDLTNKEYFTVRFKNDGKGIPDEFKEKIFEPFFRLRNTGQPGTGIGLSLARSLTELHNGTLELASGQTNMITFELTLPVHQKIEFRLTKWKNFN